MPLKPDLIAAMTKTELEVLKADLLVVITRPISPAGRAEVQTMLALVNQAIKKINIEKARADKAAADRRKSAGLAEHQQNTSRAIGRVSQLVAAPPYEDELVTIPILGTAIAARSTTTMLPPTKWPKGIATRGECILMRAEQLRSQIRRLLAPLEFSTEFLPRLESFIERQKQIVDQERAERKTITVDAIRDAAKAAIRPKERGAVPELSPSEWAETWKDSR